MNNCIEKNITKLLEIFNNDDYFIKLAVFDHIRELDAKEKYLKGHDIPKSDERYDSYDKELVDLFILLHMMFLDREDEVEHRISRFIEKDKEIVNEKMINDLKKMHEMDATKMMMELGSI